MFWNGRTAIDGLFDRADALSTFGRALAKLNAVNLHRSRNILKLLVTCVLETDVDLALHVLLHAAGDADATGLSKSLKTCCYVDAVPKNVAVVDDDVADIDADAELDPAIFGNGGVSLGHGALDFHGAAHCIDRTCKLDQRAIACSLDNAAAMFGNLGIDEFASDGLEGCESAFLVNAHQAAVTSNIGREDGG